MIDQPRQLLAARLNWFGGVVDESCELSNFRASSQDNDSPVI